MTIEICRFRQIRIILKILSAGAALFLWMPFWDLIDPLGLSKPFFSQTHLEKRWKAVYQQPLGKDQVSFQWLGATGFKVQKGDCVILIDPYLTRVPLIALFTVPLEPAAKTIEEKIPKADYIFVTDSHFDHFMDVPVIAKRTGAKVIGSSTTAKLLRVFKIPESQIVEVKGGEVITAGPFTVRVAKAVHGDIYVFKPFHSDVPADLKPPLRVWEYSNLQNFCYHFTTDGLSFFTTSSADFDESDLRDFQSDIVMANVTTLAPGYIEKLMRCTRPKMVFPTHYDNYFEPFSDGVKLFPIMDLDIFCQEVQKSDPSTQIITLDFFQEYRK